MEDLCKLILEIQSTFTENCMKNYLIKNVKLIELKDTDILKIKKFNFSISPFGGEICYREFESFLYRCVLIKPNMEHLRTWPDYYIENKTYLPMKQDDLDEEFI